MNKNVKKEYRAVVIGASSGGQAAVSTILGGLPKKFQFSIMIVIHRGHEASDFLERSLDKKCKCRVKQADDKEVIETSTVYVAPPDYHMLVEDDGSLSLSIGLSINYSRPSIDALFESAAEVFCDELVGIVLTGANNDGSRGLKRIGDLGGLTVVQDPFSAESPTMPRSAIAMAHPNHVLPFDKISSFLLELGKKK